MHELEEIPFLVMKRQELFLYIIL